jgi:hypothetical protein
MRYNESPRDVRSRDRILVGGGIFRTPPDWPWAQPPSSTFRTGSLSWGLSDWDVALNSHPS